MAWLSPWRTSRALLLPYTFQDSGQWALTSSAVRPCLSRTLSNLPLFHWGFLNLPQPFAPAQVQSNLSTTRGRYPAPWVHFLFYFLSSPSFPRPTTVTHWSLLSKNYSMSAILNSYTLLSPTMSFLSLFYEQLFQITPIVQSHQHHPSSHPLLTLPSFPLAQSSRWSITSTNLLPMS